MWDFKFDAPKHFNFLRREKVRTNIELDFKDPCDIWFMEEHIELTPLKETRRSPIVEKCEIKIAKEIIPENNIEKEKKDKEEESSKIAMENKKKKEDKKIGAKIISERLKRSHINEKYIPSISTSMIIETSLGPQKPTKQTKTKSQSEIRQIKKEEPVKDKISKCKSEAHIENKSKIKIPCPYSFKIQRDWESKSNKNWYSLSEKSAEKALKSMKKQIDEKKNQNLKEKEKKRFRF